MDEHALVNIWRKMVAGDVIKFTKKIMAVNYPGNFMDTRYAYNASLFAALYNYYIIYLDL